VTSIVYAITFCVCVYTFQSGIGRLTSKDQVQPLEPWRKSLWAQTFTPLFCETLQFLIFRIWAIQMSWTVVPSALPYAAENTTNSFENGGENFLQWAIVIGYVTEFLGTVSSWIPTEKFLIPESVALNTFAAGVIGIAACNIGDWTSWGMRIGLMIAVAVNRFSFGWLIALIPRELSRRFPDSKELLVRSNYLWSLYANIVGKFTLWYLST